MAAYRLEGPMKKRFTEEQIIRILQAAEVVGNVREVCRQHNITEQTFYRWRSKLGGMDVSDARRSCTCTVRIIGLDLTGAVNAT
jgi:transposase-like protein